MNLFFKTIVVLISATLVSSSQTETPTESEDTTPQVDFSWSAYKKAFSDYKENFVMSPYAFRRLFSCLQSVKLLPPNAKLQPELEKVLKLKPSDQPADKAHSSYVTQWLRLAKAKYLNMTTMAVAIGRQKVSKAFDGITENCVIYTGYLQPTTVERITQRINEAMQNITQDSVKDFLSKTDLNRNWKFFAIDSWQFSGLWKYKFQTEFTATCNFYESKDKKGLTWFMYLEENLKYGYFPKWNVQAVEVPYHEGSPLSFVVLMPIGTSLETLINNMNQTQFKQIYSKMAPARTTVRLPQLTLNSTVPGRLIMEGMGLKVPFNEGVFQVFDEGRKVSMGDVFQKMKVDLDYEGEKAGSRYAQKRSDKLFTVNQPFVFVIFDRKDLVPVMIGYYLKTPEFGPSEEENQQFCDDPPRF